MSEVRPILLVPENMHISCVDVLGEEGYLTITMPYLKDNKPVLLTEGIRPCEITCDNTQLKALFHRWFDKNGETYALVELPTGRMGASLISNFKFTDIPSA